MAKERKITLDKNELTVFAKTSKGPQFITLNKDLIRQISFEKCTVKKLFKQVETEKIEIQTPKSDQPVIFYKSEEEFFDEYIKSLTEFSQKNRVKLVNNLEAENAS